MIRLTLVIIAATLAGLFAAHIITKATTAAVAVQLEYET